VIIIIIIIIIYSCDLFAAIGSFIYYFVLNSKLQRRKLEVFFLFFCCKGKKKRKRVVVLLRAYPLPSFAEQHASDSLLSCLFYLVTSAPKTKHPSSFKFLFLKIYFKLFLKYLKIKEIILYIKNQHVCNWIPW